MAPLREEDRQMYLIAFPLLLIPFVLYHMVAFLLELPLDTTLFAVPVLSGMRVAVNIGEALAMLAVLLLYVEFLKFSRFAARSVMDHLLSLMLFAAMAFEFAAVPQAGTATFLILILLSLVDMVGGLSIGALFARNLALEQPDQMSAAE
jgi:hypothetical protein